MVVSCLLHILELAGQSQETVQADPVPLALVVPIERPLLVRQAGEMRFDLPADVGGVAKPRSVVHLLDYQYVDEQLQLADARERSTRRYLRAYESHDGKTCDPPLRV